MGVTSCHLTVGGRLGVRLPRREQCCPRTFAYTELLFTTTAPLALLTHLKPTFVWGPCSFPSLQGPLPSVDEWNAETPGEPVKVTRSQDPTPGFSRSFCSPGSTLVLSEW